MKKTYTTREAADLTGLSTTSICREAAKGTFLSRKSSGRLVIDGESLMAAIAGNMMPRPKPRTGSKYDWGEVPAEWTPTHRVVAKLGCSGTAIYGARDRGLVESRVRNGATEWRRSAPVTAGDVLDMAQRDAHEAAIAEKDERIAQLGEEVARLQAERDDAIQLQQRAEDGVTVSVLREEVDRLRAYAAQIEGEAARHRARVDALTDALIEARR